MDKMEIKLKECCLECEKFILDSAIGLGMCLEPGKKRAIACLHIDVCAKYNDSISVVRCKDCVWKGTENCAMQYSCEKCGVQWRWEENDAFCSYGKLKDNDYPKEKEL